MNSAYPLGEKQTGLAVWSLVCGILSLVCFGCLSGIPAIICGHMARRKVKEAPEQYGGDGMALAGLITGYVSLGLSLIFAAAVLAAITLPAFAGASDAGQAARLMSGARQIGTGMHAVANMEPEPGKPTPGYPADAGLTSASEVAQMLVSYGIFTEEDLQNLRFEDFDVGNVSAMDPADTIVLRSKSSLPNRRAIVLLKSGEGFSFRPEQAQEYVQGELPPRSPAFLP